MNVESTELRLKPLNAQRGAAFLYYRASRCARNERGEVGRCFFWRVGTEIVRINQLFDHKILPSTASVVKLLKIGQVKFGVA